MIERFYFLKGPTFLHYYHHHHHRLTKAKEMMMMMLLLLADNDFHLKRKFNGNQSEVSKQVRWLATCETGLVVTLREKEKYFLSQSQRASDLRLRRKETKLLMEWNSCKDDDYYFSLWWAKRTMKTHTNRYSRCLAAAAAAIA